MIRPLIAADRGNEKSTFSTSCRFASCKGVPCSSGAALTVLQLKIAAARDTDREASRRQILDLVAAFGARARRARVAAQFGRGDGNPRAAERLAGVAGEHAAANNRGAGLRRRSAIARRRSDRRARRRLCRSKRRNDDHQSCHELASMTHDAPADLHVHYRGGGGGGGGGGGLAR